MLVPCVCVCCVGSGFCDELTKRSGESYGVSVGVCVCDLEPSKTRRPRPHLGSCPTENKNLVLNLPVFWTRRCAHLCIDAIVSADLAVLVRRLWECHILHILHSYVHIYSISSHFQRYKY